MLVMLRKSKTFENYRRCFFAVLSLIRRLSSATAPSTSHSTVTNLLLFIANSFRHTCIPLVPLHHKRANAVRHSNALGSQLPLPGDVVNDETT